MSADQEFASATALRQKLDQPDFIKKFTPAYHLLETAPKVTWSDLFPYLHYQIVTYPDLTDYYQVNQELSVRIREALKSSETIEELVEQVATKRYTKARVRRLLTYILVGARQEELPSGIHILGFSEQGRQHLSKLKGKVDLASRIGKEPWDGLTQQADKVYQLGNPALAEQDFGRFPLQNTL